MQAGLVVGTATSTVKHPSLESWRLLVVQVYASDGKTPDGEPVLAADPLGAGRGQTVLVTSDGRGARQLLKSEQTPVRWTVLGVVD